MPHPWLSFGGYLFDELTDRAGLTKPGSDVLWRENVHARCFFLMQMLVAFMDAPFAAYGYAFSFEILPTFSMDSITNLAVYVRL